MVGAGRRRQRPASFTGTGTISDYRCATRSAYPRGDDGGLNCSSATTSSKPYRSVSSIAERREALVALVVTETRGHEGAGAGPDTGRLGNAFPWRDPRVVRRPREGVPRPARDIAGADHWLAASKGFRDLHALAGRGPGPVVLACLAYVRNQRIVSDLWRRR